MSFKQLVRWRSSQLQFRTGQSKLAIKPETFHQDFFQQALRQQARHQRQTVAAIAQLVAWTSPRWETLRGFPPYADLRAK